MRLAREPRGQGMGGRGRGARGRAPAPFHPPRPPRAPPREAVRIPMRALVLPKGRLERATLDLFDAADLTVRRSSDRDYHASIDDPRIDKVRFLRPQEIPSYLERGDRSRRGLARRVAVFEGHLAAGAGGARRTGLRDLAVGLRPAGRSPDLHRVPVVDQAV